MPVRQKSSIAIGSFTFTPQSPVANDPLPSPTASLQDWRTSIFHCFPISHLFVNHWVPLRTPLVFRGLSLNVRFLLAFSAQTSSSASQCALLGGSFMATVDAQVQTNDCPLVSQYPANLLYAQGMLNTTLLQLQQVELQIFQLRNSVISTSFQHISTSFTHFSFFIIFQGGGPQWLIFFGLRSQEIICSSTCRPSPRRKIPSLDARRTPPMPCLPRRKCWRTSAMCRRRPGRLNEGRNGKNMRQLRIRQSSWTSRCSADSFHCSWRVSGWKIDLSITILMSQTREAGSGQLNLCFQHRL